MIKQSDVIHIYCKKLKAHGKGQKDATIPADQIGQFATIANHLENWLQTGNNSRYLVDESGKEEFTRLLNYCFRKDKKLTEAIDQYKQKYQDLIDLESLIMIICSIKDYVQNPKYEDSMVFKEFCSSVVHKLNDEVRKFQVGTIGKFTKQHPSRSIAKDIILKQPQSNIGSGGINGRL
jgi:hypothetical protein